jgi:hypothetical protein
MSHFKNLNKLLYFMNNRKIGYNALIDYFNE